MKEGISMLSKVRMLPPIRADTAERKGEPQLLKKRLKMENLHSKEMSEIYFFMEDT